MSRTSLPGVSDRRKRMLERRLKRFGAGNTAPASPTDTTVPRRSRIGRAPRKPAQTTAPKNGTGQKKRSILDTISQAANKMKKIAGFDYSAGVRQQLHGLYHLVQDRGLYIGPEKGIQFDLLKTLPLNDNESESVSIYKESYNANLLLTFLVGLVNKGTMIAFGPPGAGKTTTAEIVGHFMYNQSMNDIFDATIYGNPELTREEMIARLHTGKLMLGQEEVIEREFTKSSVKLLDEINRIPPGTLSSLYQTIDRGLAKYYEKVIRLKDGPIYATANAPDSGNWPLPPPVKDRFDLAIVANEMNPTFIEHFDNRGNENLGGSLDDLLKIPKQLQLGPTSLKAVREKISEVEIDREAMNQLIFFICEMNYCDQAGIDLAGKTKANAMTVKPGRSLCSKCHYKEGICSCTQEAISPRSYKAIITYAKALAWWRGKNSVDVEDIKQIIPYTIWHKLTLTEAAKEWDPRYANDKIQFVRDCFEESQKVYQQSESAIPELGKILSSIVKSYNHICRVESNGKMDAQKKTALKDEIEEQLGELQKLDTPAKYAIAVGLKFVYERLI
ncbi:MAG: AAA family ATPase [Nanoarchaeota archaeon]|nr:AAA family ATPase [Nanoarchaeota archaeon]